MRRSDDRETRKRRPECAYPAVLGEEETLDLILQGMSIGRLGDGEFNHLRGRKNVSQVADPRLTEELIRFVAAPPKNCLVGIPTMNPAGPKYQNWMAYRAQYAGLLACSKAKFGSAFITRPDSAPWINNATFYDKVESLWRDQDVTLVANGVRSLKPNFLLGTGAYGVSFVQCTYRDSYAQIDALYARCVSIGNQRVILCCGPTATVLAGRLAATRISGQSMHAIDLGHIGMFWRRYNEQSKEKAA